MSTRKPPGDATARAEKQVGQQSAAAARGQEQSKVRSSGRDKLVLYKATKSPASVTTTTSNGGGSSGKKRGTSSEEHRTTHRLVSFNTPQQSRTFWF